MDRLFDVMDLVLRIVEIGLLTALIISIRKGGLRK